MNVQKVEIIYTVEAKNVDYQKYIDIDLLVDALPVGFLPREPKNQFDILLKQAMIDGYILCLKNYHPYPENLQIEKLFSMKT